MIKQYVGLAIWLVLGLFIKTYADLTCHGTNYTRLRHLGVVSRCGPGLWQLLLSLPVHGLSKKPATCRHTEIMTGLMVSFSLKNDATCKLLPPNALKHLKEDWNRYLVTQLHASKTFKQFFSDKQAQWIMHGKFSVRKVTFKASR